MDWRLSGKQIILLTVITANVLLIVLIWAKQQITIPASADSIPTITNDSPNIVYEYELENVSITDDWRIEHYRQYALTVSNTGEVLSKKSTGETQHLKYYKTNR